MWTRQYSFAALALLCFAFPATGQRHSLSGKITVAGDADVLQALVLVKSEDLSRTLAYTSPNSEGYYTLTFSPDEEYVHISVRGLGLKMVTERVSSSVGSLDFTIETETYSLKEVIINAEKIEQKNDTIKYNIAAFRMPEDRVIEDVIRKLPGITVQDGGRILYKGKPVSLTIDGQDLLKGKYSIATRKHLSRSYFHSRDSGESSSHQGPSGTCSRRYHNPESEVESLFQRNTARFSRIRRRLWRFLV